MIIINILLFIFGLASLVKGADFLVDGASSVARRFKVSELVIGLTIVAFGTSMPELIVSLFSAINHNADISIGNIIGSNTANILLILGISSIIYPLTVKKGTVWKEIPFSLLAALMVFFLANDQIIDGGLYSIISRIDGLVLLAFFAIFLYYTFGISNTDIDNQDNEKTKSITLTKSIFFIILGLGLLIIGGKFVVNSAVSFATMLGVSQSLIGLTIVAIGTSLPELATSAIAAYKKKNDIAIGNVVGSNIFNIFFILGISSLITPLNFDIKGNIDVLVTTGTSLALFLMMFIGKKHTLERKNGIVFLILYAAYVTFLIIRG